MPEGATKSSHKRHKSPPFICLEHTRNEFSDFGTAVAFYAASYNASKGSSSVSLRVTNSEEVDSVMTLKIEARGSVSDNLEEAGLIAQLRDGDESAWETLVQEYAKRLLATAMRILRDEQEAEDVVQEAFLVGCEHAHAF